jgi:hypothetical protein
VLPASVPCAPILAARAAPSGIGPARIYGGPVDDRRDPEPEEIEGGEAACFAHLLCEECGAVQPGPHHAGCSAAPEDGRS